MFTLVESNTKAKALFNQGGNSLACRVLQPLSSLSLSVCRSHSGVGPCSLARIRSKSFIHPVMKCVGLHEIAPKSLWFTKCLCTTGQVKSQWPRAPDRRQMLPRGSAGCSRMNGTLCSTHSRASKRATNTRLFATKSCFSSAVVSPEKPQDTSRCLETLGQVAVVSEPGLE